MEIKNNMEFTQEEIYHIRMALKFYANKYNDYMQREIYILDNFPNDIGLSENDINVVKELRSRFNDLAKAMTEQEFKKEVEDMVPITLLSEEDRAIAKEMSKENSLNAIKYIKEHSGGKMGLKMSKWYYDMYFNNKK